MFWNQNNNNIIISHGIITRGQLIFLVYVTYSDSALEDPVEEHDEGDGQHGEPDEQPAGHRLALRARASSAREYTLTKHYHTWPQNSIINF